MKIIERPMSTTLVDEVMFHLVRDQQEMDNVEKYRIAHGMHYVTWSRAVNPNTWQPRVYFFVTKDGILLADCSKYCCDLEHLGSLAEQFQVPVD